MLGLALLGLVLSIFSFSVGHEGGVARHQRDILSLPSQSRSLKVRPPLLTASAKDLRMRLLVGSRIGSVYCAKY